MKDQIARDKIQTICLNRVTDFIALDRRVSKLEKDGLTYRRCPKCKRNTLQICYPRLQICYIGGNYRCTLCDSLISCHQETRCDVVEEEK